jgi:hypothetical protein
MAAQEYRWTESALDRVRVMQSKGVNQATLYLPSTSDPAGQQSFQVLQKLLAERGVGAYADVTQQGEQVLRLRYFDNQNQLFDILEEAGCASGKPERKRIGDRQLRKEGEAPPKGKLDPVKLAGGVGFLGLSLIPALGFFNIFKGRQMVRHYEKLEEAKKNGEDVTALEEKNPAKITVTRLGRGKDENGEPTKGWTHKVERTWEKSEAEGLIKQGQSQLRGGLSYMAGMLVNFRFGGGQRAVPVDEMMRSALGKLERDGENVHAGPWAGVETSTAQDRGLIGGAVNVVREYPVQAVSAFMMGGNIDTTLAGAKKAGTNKSGRMNKVIQEVRESLLKKPEIQRQYQQLAADMGVEGEAQKQAIAEQWLSDRVLQEIEKSSDLKARMEKAGKFDFWEDAVKNYQGWGGLLSVATDAVNVAVPQATPEELAEMKASGHPIKSSGLYQWLAKDPMVVNKIAVPEKVASAFFGYQSGDTWFEQATVVARNVMFAGYRFLLSLGKKGAQAEDNMDHFKPLIAASANMALQAPDDVTRNIHISKMAAAHVEYMFENGLLATPENEEDMQKLRTEKGKELKKLILEKTHALEANPWLNVRQPEQGKSLAPASELEHVSGLDRGTTTSVMHESQQPAPVMAPVTPQEQQLTDAAKQQSQRQVVQQPS